MIGVPGGDAEVTGLRHGVIGRRLALRRRAGGVDRGVAERGDARGLQPDVEREVVPALSLDGPDPGRGQVRLRAGAVDAADVDADGAVGRGQPAPHRSCRRRRARVEAPALHDPLRCRGPDSGGRGEPHRPGALAGPDLDRGLNRAGERRAAAIGQADLDASRRQHVDDLVRHRRVGIRAGRPAADDRGAGRLPQVRAGLVDGLESAPPSSCPAGSPGRPGPVPACPGRPRARSAAGTRADARDRFTHRPGRGHLEADALEGHRPPRPASGGPASGRLGSAAAWALLAA